MTAPARRSASHKYPFNVAAFANKRDVWTMKGLNLRFHLSFLNFALRSVLRSTRHRDSGREGHCDDVSGGGGFTKAPGSLHLARGVAVSGGSTSGVRVVASDLQPSAVRGKPAGEMVSAHQSAAAPSLILCFSCFLTSHPRFTALFLMAPPTHARGYRARNRRQRVPDAPDHRI